MTIIKYSDPYTDAPYGNTMDIVLPDDTSADVIREVQEFLDADYLYVKSDERKHRRHNYSLEAKIYEGSDYSYRKSPEWIYLHKERFEEIEAAMATLTETQLRRFGMFWQEGLSIREIARLEEADYKSVRESIETARKKLAGAIDNSYEELPDWDDHHVKKKHGADGENEKG